MTLGTRSVLWLPWLLLALWGCPAADTIELGGTCKDSVECKDPADTCINVVGESLCTVACSAERACPDGYACARMDVRVEGADGGDRAVAQGYCLSEARLGPHVATIAPKGAKAGGEKRKRRLGRKARQRRRAERKAEKGEGGEEPAGEAGAEG